MRRRTPGCRRLAPLLTLLAVACTISTPYEVARERRLAAQQHPPRVAPRAGEDAPTRLAGTEAGERRARAFDPITAEELLAHVSVLASDAFGGRETGTAGERLASDYIVAQLAALPGLVPAGEDGWLQTFPMSVRKRAEESAGSRSELEEPLPPMEFDDDVDGDEPPLDPRERSELGPGHNVIALLPGSDPRLSHEFIVLGAHYDHVGYGRHGNSLGGSGQIHNGADDNASGSAALLELAEALATVAQPPRRSILFQWYSGEELGLLGSQYWVAHPTRPLDQVVVQLNLDMVGRLLGGTLMVGGTGTSPGFDAILDVALADDPSLVVIRDRVGAAPSDNASFHLAGVPVLFFFTGEHADYHKPSDDAERINAAGEERVVRLVERVLRGLDALDERPPFTAAPGIYQDFWPSVRLGVAFASVPAWVVGCARVDVVVPGEPCDRGGLREGDVVFRVDGQRPKDRSELEALLALVDDARTPRRLEVWRAIDGTPPTEDDDWLEVMELVELSVSPVVR